MSAGRTGDDLTPATSISARTPGPPGARQFQRAAPHEDAVFLHQRHEVRHGAERHEVERFLQVEPRQRAAFEQRVADLEHQTRRCTGNGNVSPSFALTSAAHVGQLRLRFVVVEDDHVHAARLQSARFPARWPCRNPRR